MTPAPTVLIGLSARDEVARAMGERVVDWVRHLGYRPTLASSGGEALAWLQEHVVAASLLDAGLEAETGERVWRTVRPILGRRLVLMVAEPRSQLWFEALRAGVGALLPLPPHEATVRAALGAVTGHRFGGDGRWRS